VSTGREVREDTGWPSMPSHQKVWWGSLLVWFQESFWVRNHSLPASLASLGVGGVVAEGVRQPDALGLDAEVLDEEPLGPWMSWRASALAAGQVAVGLHPHAADRGPLALLHGLLDTGPDLGVVVAHPRVLLGLRAGEDELLVLVGEGPVTFEKVREVLRLVLADRPEPRRSRCARGRRAERVWALACAGAWTAPASSAARTSAAEPEMSSRSSRSRARSSACMISWRRGSCSSSSGISSRSTSTSRARCQTFLVEDGEVGAAEGVERPVAGRQHVAQRRRGARSRWPGCRGLEAASDQVVDALAARRRVADRHVLVERVDRLQRGCRPRGGRAPRPGCRASRRRSRGR